MERKTFSVVFFCKKTKVTRKGVALIYVRITANGQSTEIYTQCQVEPKNGINGWNASCSATRYRCGSTRSLPAIEPISSRHTIALSEKNKEPTCFAVKERLFRPDADSRPFLTELAKYCDKRQKEVGVRITQLTANKYHRLLRYLRSIHGYSTRRTTYRYRSWIMNISTVSIPSCKRRITAITMVQ